MVIVAQVIRVTLKNNFALTICFTLDREPGAAFFHRPYRVERGKNLIRIGFPAGEQAVYTKYLEKKNERFNSNRAKNRISHLYLLWNSDG